MSEAPKKKAGPKREGKERRAVEKVSSDTAKKSEAVKKSDTAKKSVKEESPKRSTEKPVAASEGVPPQTPHQPPPDLLDEKQTTQLRIGALSVWLITAILAGVLFGPAQVVLVLAAGVLGIVIWLFWSSLRTLLGETRLTGADAYAMGALRAEEEQKRAVLRALKDLEFERSVGKISEEDYKRLAQEYRFEAKRLLRQLDEDSRTVRERAMALVDQHLEKVGLGAATEEDAAARDVSTEPSTNGEPEESADAVGREVDARTSGDESTADTMHCPFCDVLMDRKPGALCPGCGALAGKKPTAERSARKDRLEAKADAADADVAESEREEADESVSEEQRNEKAAKEIGDV